MHGVRGDRPLNSGVEGYCPVLEFLAIDSSLSFSASGKSVSAYCACGSTRRQVLPRGGDSNTAASIS